MDSDKEEGGDIFLPSKMDEERHFMGNRRWEVPPPEKTVKRVVCIFAIGCSIVVLAVIVAAAIGAAVEITRLKKIGSLPTKVPTTNHPTSLPTGLEWWKTAVIYQCYPRSFQDSDGDGNGDIAGIISHVGYLSDIGIKAVWLNPIFKSPQRDNGYDISNYTDVDPLFGTMQQVLKLLDDLHARGMHLLLDFVPNHTSDEHPWFTESRQDRTNPKRDWYVWADGKENGMPPNNWISVFGGPAWTHDNLTSQYYLHQFSSFQPDLNYSNPDVRKAFEDVLGFWLDAGVDGFRIDAVVHLLEDPSLRDEPLNPNRSLTCSEDCYDHLLHIYTRNYPGIHNITRGWRRVLDSYTGQRFMVGEVYESIDVVMSYYGHRGDEFHFPFNFFLLGNYEWTGHNVDRIVNLWLDNMPTSAWPNWVLGNHDNHRIASKASPYLARALTVLLLTLPGTPTTYYGEEILMTDVNVTESERQDEYGDRDMERTPMQWSSEANAGFTTGDPWLPLADNYSVVNVRSEQDDDTSMLSLYKKLVTMRSTYRVFMNISYLPAIVTSDILAYVRYSNSDPMHFLVVINFAQHAVNVTINDVIPFKPFPSSPEVFLSSYLNRTGMMDLSYLDVLGGEALIFSLS